MPNIKTFVIAAGFASLLTAGALAQTPGPATNSRTPGGAENANTTALQDDDWAEYYNTRGERMRRNVNAAHRGYFSSNAREVPAGTMFYRSKGKTWMMDGNAKMSNGKSAIDNWDRLEQERLN